MKLKVLFILSGVIILHAIILTGISLTGGCSSPSVLGPRPFIAAPPPQDEIISDEEIIKDPDTKVTVSTHTITPKAMKSPPTFNLGPSPKGIYYTVKKNDSFWKIAKNHGVTMQSLAAYNDMPLNKILQVGDKLRIPAGGYVVKMQPAAKSIKAASTPKSKPMPLPTDGVYIVKSGDSFWKIAKRYNLKTRTLLDANNMTGKETLQIGQKLIIPDGNKTAAAASTASAAPATPKTADDSILDMLNTVDGAEPKTKTPPKADKKIVEDDNIDGSDDSERAVQVIKDIKVEDFAKQYNVSTTMLKKLNSDYPTDGVFKAESVVIIRSE